jgi:hypothetical protein
MLCGLMILSLVYLNSYSVPVADDYWHAHFIVKKDFYIAPFSWVYGQYMNWTGRIFSSVMQGIFIVDPLYTNFISMFNILIFFSTSFYFFKQYGGKREIVPIFFSALFFVFYNIIGEAISWNSSVYLWPIVLFVVTRKSLLSKNRINLLLYFLLLCLGNSTLQLILPSIYLLFKNRHRLNKQMVAFFSLGVVLRFVAPGNKNRMMDLTSDIPTSLSDVIINTGNVISGLIDVMNLNFIVALAIMAFSSHNLKFISEKINETLVFAFGSLIPLFFLPGMNSPRTYTYFLFFLTFFSFKNISKVRDRIIRYLPKFSIVLFKTELLGCVLATILITSDFSSAKLMRKKFLSHVDILKKKKGEKVLILKTSTSDRYPDLLYYRPLSKDHHSFENRSVAKYYEIEVIQIED